DEVKLTDLDTLTRQSDFITVHVPKLESTDNLFDLERIKMMKSTAMLINVARGGIINEDDLALAVKQGIIAGAAIDVFVKEPIEKDHPFTSIDNILMTPHLGASTKEAKEGVSVTICELVRDYIIDNKLSSALNIPITDMNILKQIQPHLLLAEKMGIIQGQLAQGAIQKVKVNVQGLFDDIKPFMLSFIKGLLNDLIPERVNYINAEFLAKERGIIIEYGANNEDGSYTNLIYSCVVSGNVEKKLEGSVFDGNQLRLVNILGYDMDINPIGNLLFIKNEDVPGVIGKVGTLLGKNKINIGAYILSNTSEMDEAFAVIRLDAEVPSPIIQLLVDIPEIISVKQIIC
ncbi:MAG: NAD(P)-dependent oxidoreductase, partial [Candidatus Neomarinimicrobiota bacterium]